MTVTELAELAGVSVATVSRVFNGKELNKVSTQTRERIEELMAKYGYTPNANARRLATGLSRLIGFQVPSIRSPIVNSAVLEALTLRAAQSGFGVIAGLNSGNGDADSIEHMLRQGADALLWQPCGDPDQQLLVRIRARRLPVVWFNKELDLYPVVRSDEMRTGELAASFLLEQGAEKFYFIAGASDGHTAARRKGFEKILAGRNFEFIPSDSPSGDIPERAKAVLSEHCGFFCSSHFMAVKLERQRRTLGVKCVPVCAHGDSELADQYDSHVTLIAPDGAALGRAAFDMLEARIAGKTVPDYIIPPRLIIRGA